MRKKAVVPVRIGFNEMPLPDVLGFVFIERVIAPGVACIRDGLNNT